MKRQPPPLSTRLDGIPVGTTDRAVPTEFRIFKAGENPSEKGLFKFTDASARTVMAAFAAHAKPMLLDYNHGTTLEAATPEQAIAAGQFTPEIRGGELWATDIKWTDRARALLSAGEYRLFSPFFTHDKDGQVLRLVNVALTNLPALDGIAPLVAASASTHDQEPEMETCTACAALSAQLSSMKTERDALQAKCFAFEKKDADGDADAAKASALRVDIAKLTGQSEAPAAVGVLSAWKASHDRVAALSAELDGIKSKALSDQFTAVLDKAVADKLITPSQKKDFWEAKCRVDGKVTADGLGMLTAFVATATPIVATAATAGADAGSTAIVIPASQQAMATHMSIDTKKFAEYKAAQLAGR